MEEFLLPWIVCVFALIGSINSLREMFVDLVLTQIVQDTPCELIENLHRTFTTKFHLLLFDDLTHLIVF